MESQAQNPEFRNNPENFHPRGYSSAATSIGVSLHVFYSVYISATIPLKSHHARLIRFFTVCFKNVKKNRIHLKIGINSSTGKVHSA